MPLSKQAHRIGHAWLDSVERVIASIVMLRAAPHVRRVLPRKGVSQHRRNDTALRRAVIGSALRRALRPKRLLQRIAALTQDIDALVARLLKRLPRGLTRRRPIITAPEQGAADAQSALPAPALGADTS